MSRRTALATAALAVLAAAPAAATDWSVRGFFSQRLELDSDTGGDSEGTTGNAITSLGLIVSAIGEQTTMTFAPGLTGIIDTDQGFDATNVLPRLNFSITHAVSPVLSLNASASVVPRLTNFSSIVEDEDFGPVLVPEFTDRTALQLVGRASAGASYRVDPLNTLSLSTFTVLRRYVDADEASGFSDTDQYGVTARWSHSLTPLTALSLNTGWRTFSDRGSDGQTSDTFDIGLGLSGRLSPTLGYGLDAGTGYTVSDDPDQDGTFSFIGGGRLSYRGPGYGGAAGVRFDVDQNEDGALESQATAFLTANYALTPQARLAFVSSVTRSSPLSGGGSDEDETRLSIGPSLSYRLTRDWTASTGYRLRTDIEGGDGGLSNLFFLQIARNLELL